MRNGINNKALFITALGVYFGLMLSGAAPNALARQAAITRNFDVSDEIEINEGPGKDPDADKAIEEFASALLEIYRITSEISANAPDELESGRFNFSAFITVNKRGGGSMLFSGMYNSGRFIYSGRQKWPLFRLYDSVLPREEKQSHRFRVDFQLEQDTVSLQTNLFADNPSNAERIARLYDEVLLSRKEMELTVLRSLIYSTMDISVEDKQVIIVSHLPRASIDPLLATDEMQRR